MANKESALTELRELHQTIADLTAKVPDAVMYARKHKASWADIGKALGVTRQATWEKYKDADRKAWEWNAPPRETE